jgi:hypothetical protein
VGDWLRVANDSIDQVAPALRDVLGQSAGLAVLLGMRVAQIAFLPQQSVPAKMGREVLLAQGARLLHAAPEAVTVDSQRMPDGVMLAAARTDPVVALRTSLEEAGFNVVSAEPASISFIRALALDGPILAVRLGDGEAEMTAAQQHRIQFSRRCSWTDLDTLSLEIAETVRGHRVPADLEVVISGAGAEEMAQRLKLPWPHRLATVGADMDVAARQHLVPIAGALAGRKQMAERRFRFGVPRAS